MSYTNKKTVGRIVKICVFLLILVILVANVVQCFRSFYHNLEIYKMEHFWKYKWAFANVAKFCLEQFTLALKENETLSQISIDYNLTEKNEFQVTYYYYGDAEPTDQLVPIDQTMIKSFDTVKRAFEQKADGKHYRFTHLTVYKNFVRFNTYGPYYLVYSKYDRPPTYGDSFFVDKMQSRWFHVLSID